MLFVEYNPTFISKSFITTCLPKSSLPIFQLRFYSLYSIYNIFRLFYFYINTIFLLLAVTCINKLFDRFFR